MQAPSIDGSPQSDVEDQPCVIGLVHLSTAADCEQGRRLGEVCLAGSARPLWGISASRSQSRRPIGAPRPREGYVAVARGGSVPITWEQAARLYPVADDGWQQPPRGG